MPRLLVFAVWGVLLSLICLPAAQAQSDRPLSADDIEALRARGETEGWTFALRESEATRRPLSELCGLVEPKDWRSGATFDPCTPTRDLRSAFNWCDEVGCPLVKDQDGCGQVVGRRYE